MKLENCGRCGLEAETGQDPEKEGSPVSWPVTFCPVHGNHCRGMRDWNAAQFAARTERINAAAVAIYVRMGYDRPAFAVDDAAAMIEAQDERARVRWAEMQGENRRPQQGIDDAAGLGDVSVTELIGGDS